MELDNSCSRVTKKLQTRIYKQGKECPPEPLSQKKHQNKRETKRRQKDDDKFPSKTNPTTSGKFVPAEKCYSDKCCSDISSIVLSFKDSENSSHVPQQFELLLLKRDKETRIMTWQEKVTKMMMLNEQDIPQCENMDNSTTQCQGGNQLAEWETFIPRIKDEEWTDAISFTLKVLEAQSAVQKKLAYDWKVAFRKQATFEELDILNKRTQAIQMGIYKF